jgi:hypothetical protein
MLRPREQGFILIFYNGSAAWEAHSINLRLGNYLNTWLKTKENQESPCRDDRSQEFSDIVTSSALRRPCPSSWPLYPLLLTQRFPLLFLGHYLTYQWEQSLSSSILLSLSYAFYCAGHISLFLQGLCLTIRRQLLFRKWMSLDFSVNRPSATVACSDVVLLGYFVESGNSLWRNGDTPSGVSFSTPAYPVCFTGAGSVCVRRCELRKLSRRFLHELCVGGLQRLSLPRD